jgi:hypothetical protein
MSTELANARAALAQASAKGVGRSLRKARLEKVPQRKSWRGVHIQADHYGGSPVGTTRLQQSAY